MKRLLCMGMIVAVAVVAQADTFTFRNGENAYAGTDDSYIKASAPTTKYGATSVLYVRNDNIHGMLRFDLSDLSGLVETVTNATLTLYDADAGAAGVNDVVFHRLLKDWVEADVTYNEYSSGNAWETAGAFGATDRGPALVTNTMLVGSGSYEVDIPLAMVQDWIENPASNYGLLLDAEDSRTMVVVPSEHPTAAWRPMLTVGATVKETEIHTFRDGVDGYAGTDDAFLKQSDPTATFGAVNYMYIRSDGLHGMFRFDLSSLEGQVAEVAAATLTLYDSSGETGTNPAELHRVLKDWVEAEVSFNDCKGSTPWQTAGAAGATDRGPVLGTVDLLVGVDANYDIGIPVSLVEDWIDNPSSNHGIILDATVGYTVFLSASEHVTESRRPMLTLETVPFPPRGTIVVVK